MPTGVCGYALSVKRARDRKGSAVRAQIAGTSGPRLRRQLERDQPAPLVQLDGKQVVDALATGACRREQPTSVWVRRAIRTVEAAEYRRASSAAPVGAYGPVNARRAVRFRPDCPRALIDPGRIEPKAGARAEECGPPAGAQRP